MIDKASTKRFWDSAAKTCRLHDPTLAGMLMENDEFGAVDRKNAEERHLLEFVKSTVETSVLEVGSGGGRWGFFFADKVSCYVGLDVSPEMVTLAENARIKRKLSNISFQVGDLRRWKSSQKFDIVYFSAVLQYMDDDAVADCIRKADENLSEGGVIVSRDTIQSKERVERGGEYPVIYRRASEYEGLFRQASYRLAYSEVSYPRKRFTRIVSRLYRLPLVTYAMANAVCKTLCQIDRLLGGPEFLKSSAYRRMLAEENRQEHRFFKYVRAA